MDKEKDKEVFNISKDIVYKKRKDGRNYSVRIDRRRFFYPEEWKLFIKQIKPETRLFFEIMLNTGARFDEAVHLRPIDFDFERSNVRLWKTKTKAKKGESFGKPRTISLDSEFSNRVKRVCNSKKKDGYIYEMTIQGANQLMKRILKKVGVKDYYNFSTHNIRKTHGMYLKALGVDMGEICTRLGHDADTYISHYGSADVFSEKDMRGIRELFGDLYLRQRKF